MTNRRASPPPIHSVIAAVTDTAHSPAWDARGSYTSVLDAIADTPDDAANLRVRADLMTQIAVIVGEAGWTQVEAASHCGVTQPRVNDLLRGRISRFSLDALVKIVSALGRRVRVGLAAG